MRISAVLACRNEERFITAWLEETSAYADEILIAIHAPTDATAELIAKFRQQASIPIHSEWFPASTVARFGFSLMKNEMVAAASGDWITSIDADEEIGLSRDALHDAIESAQRQSSPAVSLQWASHPQPGDVRECSMADRAVLRQAHVTSHPVTRKTKVFCNHSVIWWRGQIHEALFRGAQDVSRVCYDHAGLLHHYDYLQDQFVEWKLPLYHYLLCRTNDCPPLRFGTNRWWYDVEMKRHGDQIRQNAAKFVARRDEWFPELPARTI